MRRWLQGYRLTNRFAICRSHIFVESSTQFSYINNYYIKHIMLPMKIVPTCWKIGLASTFRWSNSQCRHSNAWSVAQKTIDGNLKTINDEGTWKKERIIAGKQGAHIRVQNSDRRVINFCANNYLGLSVRFVSLNNVLYI